MAGLTPGARRPVKLSRLRDIGWSTWDPIGILAKGELGHHQPFADEYDGYLLQVVGMLRREGSAPDAVAYLIRIESDHMGLGVRPTARARAEAVVSAIELYLQAPSTG